MKDLKVGDFTVDFMYKGEVVNSDDEFIDKVREDNNKCCNCKNFEYVDPIFGFCKFNSINVCFNNSSNRCSGFKFKYEDMVTSDK